MSKKRIRPLLAPGLAVAAIALCYGWFVFRPEEAPSETNPADASKAPVAQGRAAPSETSRADASAASVAQGRAAPSEARGSGDQSWSTYHGDAALTGAVETALPDAPARLWLFQADAAVYHTPVACGGRIYFTTAKGGVYALDLEGNEVWSKHVVRGTKRDGSPRMVNFDAPTACFESTLLAGSLDGTLYAFDSATGDENWTYDVGGPILGTPNLLRPADAQGSARIVIIGQDDGTLHCIDLTNGELLWKTEGIDRCDGSPAVGENTIVFGSCAAAIHVFSAIDGKLQKNIEIDADSQIAGGVAIVGDSVFSGSVSGKLIHANLRTGKIVWINEDSDFEVFTTPAVNRDWVVFGSEDGSVYALERETGKQQWKFETDGWPTSPVIAAGKVVVGFDGTLYLLHLKTGEELWSYEVSDEITSPAIIGGMIVVGSEDGTVTAFGEVRS